jgi:hypothetical protein
VRALLELVVVAEDLIQVALHELPQAVDGDQVEPPAGPQPGAGVVQQQGQQFLADLGRDVARDQVEAQRRVDLIETVAELRAALPSRSARRCGWRSRRR